MLVIVKFTGVIVLPPFFILQPLFTPLFPPSIRISVFFMYHILSSFLPLINHFSCVLLTSSPISLFLSSLITSSVLLSDFVKFTSSLYLSILLLSTSHTFSSPSTIFCGGLIVYILIYTLFLPFLIYVLCSSDLFFCCTLSSFLIFLFWLQHLLYFMPSLHHICILCTTSLVSCSTQFSLLLLSASQIFCCFHPLFASHYFCLLPTSFLNSIISTHHFT